MIEICITIAIFAVAILILIKRYSNSRKAKNDCGCSNCSGCSVNNCASKDAKGLSK